MFIHCAELKTMNEPFFNVQQNANRKSDSHEMQRHV